MLLQVSGEPFREGRRKTAAASVRILSGVYPEAPHGFTLGEGRWGARIPVSSGIRSACFRHTGSGLYRKFQQSLSYDRRDVRQTLFMVFCRRKSRYGKARSARMTSLVEPDYRNPQAALEMFEADANDELLDPQPESR